MDYYLIKPDNEINSPLNLNDYFNQFDTTANINTDTVIKSDVTEATKLIDYARLINRHISYHMFSDKIKSVINGYKESIDFYGVFVTSLDMEQQYAYWRMDTLKLKRIIIEDTDDVLVDDIRDINKIELNHSEIGSSLIFCIVKSRHDYIVVREDLAEGILRRCPIGIKFVKLTVR